MPVENVPKKMGWETADASVYLAVQTNAVENRKAMTTAERILWEQLRSGRLGKGIRFRRQHVIGTYIADFVCLKSRLVVEVDGKYHQQPDQRTSDQYRTDFLNGRGFRVIRFTNKQVIEDTETVMSIIIKSLINNK